MTAECCNSEIETRYVPFGKTGLKVEIKTCECEAHRLCVKYMTSKFQEETDED